MKKTVLWILLAPVALITGALMISYGAGLSSDIKIGGAYDLGPVPDEVIQVQDHSEPLANASVEMKELPGHDDLVFDVKSKIGYASGMDGWVWKLDFASGEAKRWVELPVNPAGMQFANSDRDRLLVCASRLGGEEYPPEARVGLYEIEIDSGEYKPLVLDLPELTDPGEPVVYAKDRQDAKPLSQLSGDNSRPFSLCNDLAVSSDGNRIYLTEPFRREDAAMGSGAVPEAIGLYPHGKLWMYDRGQNTISLVLDGFTFIDGILLEESGEPGAPAESSVIFTETTRFRMIRAFLTGEKAGQYEVLQDNLPGLADGLERDSEGRIWTGIIKKRSGLINLVHANPWLKPMLLGLPQALLPVSKATGIMVFDPTGRQTLYFSMHDGSHIMDISVAVPMGDRIYLPTFKKSARGLYSIPLASFPTLEENH